MKNINQYRVSWVRRAKARTGLSLVEVMISTALSAILLTAAGMAYSASIKAIEINDRFFTASQAARVSITQMTSAFRRGSNLTVTANSARVLTSDGHDRTYTFDVASQQLKMVANDSVGTPTYILARNVTAAAFSADLDAGSIVTRVAISLTVQVNCNQVLLSGSAAPRSNVTYQ